MSSSAELLDHAERRWVIVGVGVALSLLVVQVVAGYTRQAAFPGPSFLQKVERCLVERKTPFAQVTGDPIAQSAQRGALRTRVQGDAVTVVLGGSEKDAERIYADYADVATPAVVRTQLERHRKVVFLWSFAPSASQRQFAYLCTLDAQG